MAKFDEVFAELQAKMGAALEIIAQNPELAAQVRAAIENAQTEAEIQERQAQDEARANALAGMILNVRETLQEAVAGPAYPPGFQEPQLFTDPDPNPVPVPSPDAAPVDPPPVDTTPAPEGATGAAEPTTVTDSGVTGDTGPAPVEDPAP